MSRSRAPRFLWLAASQRTVPILFDAIGPEICASNDNARPAQLLSVGIELWLRARQRAR